MLRVGLIGAGNLGRAHAESLAYLPDVELVAVADVESQATQQLKQNWAPHAAEMEWVNLVDSPDIDAVVVATPTPFHFQQAHRALAIGKHVYLEIPMARRLDEAEKLVAAAQRVGVTLTVGHSLRGYAEYRLIKQKVDEDAAGKPGMIRLERRTPHPRRWYSNFESSGGVVLDSMIHEFDYIHWVFGPVQRVYCQSMKGRSDTQSLDYALASLRLKNGSIAHVESSWCHYGQYHLEVEIAGNKGLIQYSNEDSIPLYVSIIDPQKGTRQFYSESPVIKPAHYNLMEGFIQAIQGTGDNPVSPEEGLEALKVAHAALESMRTHGPVEIH